MKRLFVETRGFDADRADLEKAGELVDDDLAKMEQEIMENPKAGDLVKGSGGLRKIRVGLSARRRGKSYGARVAVPGSAQPRGGGLGGDLREEREGRSVQG